MIVQGRFVTRSTTILPRIITFPATGEGVESIGEDIVDEEQLRTSRKEGLLSSTVGFTGTAARTVSDPAVSGRGSATWVCADEVGKCTFDLSLIRATEASVGSDGVCGGADAEELYNRAFPRAAPGRLPSLSMSCSPRSIFSCSTLGRATVIGVPLSTPCLLERLLL